MTAPRFHVDADLVAGSTMPLPDGVAHHATRVLRLRDGAPLLLFNGRGGEFSARLRLGAHAPHAEVLAFDPVERESPLRLTLVQAWIASEKLDWVVEKSVELGVARIVLFPAERSVVRIDGARRDKRLAHLAGIVVSACAQCGRNRLPPVAAVEDAAGAAGTISGATRRLVLAPGAGPALSALAAGAADIALMAGPEGGFTDGEIAMLARAGWQRGQLGPRVLRTETAGIAALAALQAVRGDLAS